MLVPSILPLSDEAKTEGAQYSASLRPGDGVLMSVRCTRYWGSCSLHALQVTPVFGILNDLQQRRAGSDGNGGPGGMVPQKVVLVYVASMKNELALLQRPLIADAM